MIKILPERPTHGAAIDQLLATAFGQGRTDRAVYRLRRGVGPVAALCFVAEQDSALRASIRFWPVTLGGQTPALLLGPLSVAPEDRGRGIGIALVRHALVAATAQGHRLVFVSGEPYYYARFGFRPAVPLGFASEVAIESWRWQVAELSAGALDGVSGTVGRWSPRKPALPAFAPPGERQRAQAQEQDQ